MKLYYSHYFDGNTIFIYFFFFYCQTGETLCFETEETLLLPAIYYTLFIPNQQWWFSKPQIFFMTWKLPTLPIHRSQIMLYLS